MFNGELLEGQFYDNKIIMEEPDEDFEIEDQIELRKHFGGIYKGLEMVLKKKNGLSYNNKTKSGAQVKGVNGVSTKGVLAYDEEDGEAFWTYQDFDLIDEKTRVENVAFTIAHQFEKMIDNMMWNQYNIRFRNVKVWNLVKDTIAGGHEERIVTRTEIRYLNERIVN